MALIKILLTAGALILTVAILWAFSVAPFWESVTAIGAMPWGTVSFIDLYLGFFCFALVIALFERRPAFAITWIVALFLLGNVAAALWLASVGLNRLARVRPPSA